MKDVHQNKLDGKLKVQCIKEQLIIQLKILI